MSSGFAFSNSLAGAMLLSAALAAQTGSISGVVRSASGPLDGAVVRVQATPVSTTANERGEFTLRDPGAGPLVPLTAFAPGYFIAGPVAVRPGATGVEIRLEKHDEKDNPNYEWLSPFASAGNPTNCQNCHSDPDKPDAALLPFDEWAADAHGRTAQNRRFLSMFNGTDLSGRNKSPLTRFTVHKDYGRVPLPPDPNLPYFGPGFKLDFPDSAGNCAACHFPNAAVRAPYDTDPNAVTGVGKESIACDLCHKVWDAKLNPSTGRPFPNTPGVLALEFRRPTAPHQLFLGPFDDVAPGEDTFSPLQNQSRFCAPCHFSQFWGVQVYNSFGEWLDSPYSDPQKGQTCQDCHMPRRGATRFARIEKGALRRDPKTIFSHLMPGAGDVPLLQDTARLDLRAQQQGSIVRVNIAVTNEKAGHHIPTDHPARNILLVVHAKDARGAALPFLRGPVVPEWGGKGDDPTDYAGQPGRGYAKVLEELWTEVSPTAAYWNPTVVREDTRIAALGKDETQYEFRAPVDGGPVSVEARLIFRRAFKVLVKQKTWDVGDILMKEASATIQADGSQLSAFTVVPAATFAGGVAVATDSLVAGFGEGLATVATTVSGASPPTLLGSTAINVTDKSGTVRPAAILYASYGQINFVVPSGTVPGPAVAKVVHSGRPVAQGRLNVEAVEPTLFSANGNGRGVTAAVAVRVAADGSQKHELTFRCGAGSGDCVAIPIEVGSESARVILQLFGSGIRGFSMLSAVKVRIGGTDAPVLWAGPHGQLAGLDQVNVLVPHSLAGRGELPIALTVEGKAANPVTVSFR